MRLERLTLARFRGFHAIEWRPTSGINFITGANGAGKTTLLEAAHLLSNGRSFRGRVRDGLVQHGRPDLEVFAEWTECGGRIRRAGLRHSGSDWQAKLDSDPVANLSTLCTALAVLTFEPGTHDLISGGAEKRRQFVDWALFHVEPDFLPLWRRYARALKQRNALLKDESRGELLDSWEREMIEAGEPLTGMRALHLSRFQELLTRVALTYLPELGRARVAFHPGWRRNEQSLSDALANARERDAALRHTSTGPHRADWALEFENLPGKMALSRGQEKLAALSCVLAQAMTYEAARGEWPVLALDDLASELDREHQQRVLDDLRSHGAQILVTGTEPSGSSMSGELGSWFHVERGEIRRLL